MLKKIIAKNSDDFYFKDNLLIMKINKESDISLSPSEVNNIWFNSKMLSIVIQSGWDKITLSVNTSEKYECVLQEFRCFFSEKDFFEMKRRMLLKLTSGAIFVSIIIIYFYLNHFERFNGIVYFLSGILIYSIIETFQHIKKINTIFRL